VNNYSYNCGILYHFLCIIIEIPNLDNSLQFFLNPVKYSSVPKNGIKFHRMRHLLSYLLFYRLKIPRNGTQFAKTFQMAGSHLVDWLIKINS
jgi:hypothetical protein